MADQSSTQLSNFSPNYNISTLSTSQATQLQQISTTTSIPPSSHAFSTLSQKSSSSLFSTIPSVTSHFLHSSSLHPTHNAYYHPTAQQLAQKNAFVSDLLRKRRSILSTNQSPEDISSDTIQIQQLSDLQDQKTQEYQQEHPSSSTLPLHTPSTTSLSFPSNPEFDTVKDLQDILYCFKTIYLDTTTSQFVPRFSFAHRKLANLLLQHSSSFFKHVDQSILSGLDKNSRLFKLASGQTRILPHQEIFSTSTAEITWNSIAELKSGCWLSMDVVNGFMGLLLERRRAWINFYDEKLAQLTSSSSSPIQQLQSAPLYPKIKHHLHQYLFPSFHALSSQFSTIFLDAKTHQFVYKYDKIQRWSMRAKVILNDLDLIVVPCHVHGNHWTLLIADIKNRLISYYDSFSQDDEGLCQLLASYLEDEWLTYGGWNGYTPAEELAFLQQEQKSHNDHQISLGADFHSTSLQFPQNTATSFNSLSLPLTDVNIGLHHPNRNIGSTSIQHLSSFSSTPLHSLKHFTTPQKPSLLHFTSPTFSTHPLLQSSFSSIPSTLSTHPLRKLHYKPFTKQLMKKIPVQTNTSDCGVFVCAFANIITLGGQVHGHCLESINRNELIANYDLNQPQNGLLFTELVYKNEISTNHLQLSQQQQHLHHQHHQHPQHHQRYDNNIIEDDSNKDMQLHDNNSNDKNDNLFDENAHLSPNKMQYKIQYAQQLAQNRQNFYQYNHSHQSCPPSYDTFDDIMKNTLSTSQQQYTPQNSQKAFHEQNGKLVFWFQQKDLVDFRKRMILAFLEGRWSSPQEDDLFPTTNPFE